MFKREGLLRKSTYEDLRSTYPSEFVPELESANEHRSHHTQNPINGSGDLFQHSPSIAAVSDESP